MECDFLLNLHGSRLFEIAWSDETRTLIFTGRSHCPACEYRFEFDHTRAGVPVHQKPLPAQEAEAARWNPEEGIS